MKKKCDSWHKGEVVRDIDARSQQVKVYAYSRLKGVLEAIGPPFYPWTSFISQKKIT